MYPFQQLMVGIDLTADNASLIRYAFHMSELFDSEKIYFVHVVGDLQVEKQKYEGEQPYDEYLQDQVKEQIRHYFSNRSLEVEINVLEGKAEEQLLHWASVKDTDLLLIGRPTLSRREEVEPHHLVRLAPSSVVIVPEKATPSSEKIFLPVDNSTYTERSIEKGEEMLQRGGKGQMILYHAIPPPNTFLTVGGRRYEQFVKDLRRQARQEIKKVVKKVESSEDIELIIETCSSHISDCIAGKASSVGADLMIIGSKGRSNAAAVLLGSVTERIIKNQPTMPTLILRKKGEHKTLIQELFSANKVYDLK